MKAPSALEEELRHEGEIEGEHDCVIFFLRDKYYLASTCMGVVSGEMFCTRN